MKEQGCEYKGVPSAACSGRWASPSEIRVRSSVIVPPGEVFQTEAQLGGGPGADPGHAGETPDRPGNAPEVP